MFRLIGFLAGIIIFIILAAEHIAGYQYYIVIAAVGWSCILLIIVFRVIAKYKNGFWKIWWKRLQKQIIASMACLGHYVQMPEYQITSLSTSQIIKEQIDNRQATLVNKIFIGLLQLIVWAIITIFCPFIFFFIIFCYIEAIKTQCQFREIEMQKKIVKQQIIARQSTKMNLGIPLYSSKRYDSAAYTQQQRPKSSRYVQSKALRVQINKPQEIYYNVNRYRNPSVNKDAKNQQKISDTLQQKSNQSEVTYQNTHKVNLIGNDQL